MNYYINANSSSPDGFTPDTGYHNFTDLIIGIILQGNDTIEVVNNGTVIESLNNVTFPYVSLSIKSWVSNTDKPTVQLGNGFTFSNKINIYDIVFSNPSGLGRIILNSVVGPSHIERNIFNKIYVSIESSSNTYVRNNIFDAHAVLIPYFILNHQRSENVFINNNDFYNLPNVPCYGVYDSFFNPSNVGSLAFTGILHRDLSNYSIWIQSAVPRGEEEISWGSFGVAINLSSNVSTVADVLAAVGTERETGTPWAKLSKMLDGTLYGFDNGTSFLFSLLSNFIVGHDVAAVKFTGTVKTARVLNNVLHSVGFAVDALEVE